MIIGDNMNNLDETLVKVAQDRQKELKTNQEELRQRVYRKSIQSANMHQRVDGEMYVGHNPKMQKFVKTAVYTATAVAAAVIIAKLGKTDEVMSTYNLGITNAAIEQEFSDTELSELKQEVKDIPVGDKMNQIQAEKEELRETGNYDMFGRNQDQSLQHEGDPNALFGLTDLERDAINNVAESQVEEYQGRGK